VKLNLPCFLQQGRQRRLFYESEGHEESKAVSSVASIYYSLLLPEVETRGLKDCPASNLKKNKKRVKWQLETY